MTRPDVTVEEMSKASYAAWAACCAVWNRLKPSEQDVIRAYHSIRASPDKNGIAERIANERGLSRDYVCMTIKKAWKMWAIERGLADE